MSAPRSVRFADDTLRRLERYVHSHPGTSSSAVVNVFVDEALRAEEHPGVMFRPGPTGRRAALLRGPDVWEVIGTLLTVRTEESGLADTQLVESTAEAMGLAPETVRVAVRYYAAYPTEVDERITANQEAVAEAEAAWHAEQQLLRATDMAS